MRSLKDLAAQALTKAYTEVDAVPSAETSDSEWPDTQPADMPDSALCVTAGATVRRRGAVKKSPHFSPGAETTLGARLQRQGAIVKKNTSSSEAPTMTGPRLQRKGALKTVAHSGASASDSTVGTDTQSQTHDTKTKESKTTTSATTTSTTPSELLTSGDWLASDAPDLRDVYVLAQLADYPYHHHDKKRLCKLGHQIDMAQSQRLASYCMFVFDPSSGLITTPNGLVTFVFKDAAGNKVLCFGGTTAGRSAGGFGTRMLRNRGEQFSQWMANAKNALVGKIPACYLEAETLARLLAADCQKAKETLTIIGHSLGGGMACYAAGMASCEQMMIKCVGFCPAELCAKMIHQLKAHLGKDFQTWLNGVVQICIKGDPVPYMHTLFPSITTLGRRFVIEPLEGTPNPLTRHIDFAHHVAIFCHQEPL